MARKLGDYSCAFRGVQDDPIAADKESANAQFVAKQDTVEAVERQSSWVWSSVTGSPSPRR